MFDPITGAIISAAAKPLFEIVADLFRSHGGATASRNADLMDKAAPVLVEIAKKVTGTDDVVKAVNGVVADPETFRAAVSEDLDRIMGIVARSVEIDDTSRDRAAVRARDDKKDFATYLIPRQFWLLVGMCVATVLAIVVALAMKASNEILVGLVVLFTGLANESKAKWGTMVEYRFGSSSGSAAKDEIIAASKK